MNIYIVQAQGGRWGYSPLQLVRVIAYDGEAPFATEAEALAAAKADKHVPKDTKFITLAKGEVK